jgi:hypothetical protein
VTPLATSERRSGTSPKGLLHTARSSHLWWLPWVMWPRRTSILKGLLKDVGGELRRERLVSLMEETLQGTCAAGVVRAGRSRAGIGRFHQPADAGPFANARLVRGPVGQI